MNLGIVLRRWRLMSDLTIRKAAEVIGVPSGTLSRVERGESMDGKTLAKLLIWLLAASKPTQDSTEA